MQMRPMVIDEDVKANVTRLVAHAQANRFSLYALKRIMEGLDRPCGDDPAFRIWIPVGYRVVFNIEQHPRPGWFRHLSVSVTAKGKFPNPAAVEMLLPLFGFRGGLEDCLARDEKIGRGRHALNVLQPEDLANERSS